VRHRWAYVRNSDSGTYDWQLIDLYQVPAIKAHIERLTKDHQRAVENENHQRASHLHSQAVFLQQKMQQVLKLIRAGALSENLLHASAGTTQSMRQIAWRLRLWFQPDAFDADAAGAPAERLVMIQEVPQ